MCFVRFFFSLFFFRRFICQFIYFDPNSRSLRNCSNGLSTCGVKDSLSQSRLFFLFSYLFYRHRSAATNRLKTLGVLKFYFYSFLIILIRFIRRNIESIERRIPCHSHCGWVNSLCKQHYDMLFVVLSLTATIIFWHSFKSIAWNSLTDACVENFNFILAHSEEEHFSQPRNSDTHSIQCYAETA